jgi:hypothetical protein
MLTEGLSVCIWQKVLEHDDENRDDDHNDNREDKKMIIMTNATPVEIPTTTHSTPPTFVQIARTLEIPSKHTHSTVTTQFSFLHTLILLRSRFHLNTLILLRLYKF